MKVITFLILLISVSALYSQAKNSSSFTGSTVVKKNINGNIQFRTITTPQVYNEIFTPKQQSASPVDQTNNSSFIRWKFTDQVAIGDVNMVSGDGLFSTVGWGLNTQRVSLYGNTNSTPVWEYHTGEAFMNYVAISDNAGIIAAGSLVNVYMFNHSSSTPFFNFNVNTLGSYNAEPIDLTSSGNFIIVGLTAVNFTTDSSIIAGFSKDSANPVWQFKVGQTGAGGSRIYGVRIAGDDSLAIVNTYGAFYVVRTYTGEIIYQGLINPLSGNNGTQAMQGISGNGNIIATINYFGYLRVFQRSGNTYNLLWQHQEPPGSYYNWMSAVDVSYDGSMIAAGTLNFLTLSIHDGKVKLFNTSSPTPLWTATGFGDQVATVSFSKNGHILSACSWGNFFNPLKDNFFIFKTSQPNNIPIYSFSDSSGSFFWCSTSDDGQTVIGSGKKVHASVFGNGGIAYNVYVDTSEPTGVLNNQNIADKFELAQNYPNPFNPSTVINYTIAKEGFVKIAVFDILGREAAVPVNEYRRPGRYSVVFNTEKFSSGMYFYRIEANGFTATKKMMLIK